ncbi:hypothetical protein B9Z55_022640 [Caenorhabditis nigoni]|uniref:Uncharacterized protein n=1 Tax=Caenorhabditis nigoni TaxID=1611254 RepID=A0A2G5SL37_9PELO|nr:hypothetical protein B9Z55_022640 [Caenorhabditis nigoni]
MPVNNSPSGILERMDRRFVNALIWIQPRTSDLSRGAGFEDEEHLQEAADQENDKKSKPDPKERLND